jgi:adenine-specific DNA-methyltransferase
MFPEHLRGLVPFSLWGPAEGGTNDDAKRHLMTMFPHEEPFATPKPEALLERIIHIASDPGDLVLDFFAGSATTAAVAHKMQRRWLAVERSPLTAARFAVPRLAKVVAGHDPDGVTAATGWYGGGSFKVATVGAELTPELRDSLACATDELSEPPAIAGDQVAQVELTLFEGDGIDPDADVA